jgi:hypothetical protein
MSHALRAPSVPTSLSELAEEFRRLDRQRRHGGLSLVDASRYHGLFARLSEVLAAGERKRRVDGRQFLRVPFDFELGVIRGDDRVAARCHDFGGGGCAVACAMPLARNDEVWLDGALFADEQHPLRGRAVVVWVRSASDGVTARVGLRFAFDVPADRDQVDRVFYRLLDRFLTA